jgi:gamma-glutamylaminecyclotransferase
VHVFVYGTLTDPDRVAEVLDEPRDWSFVGDATLHGLHRVDGRYPTLAPGGRVHGRLLETDAIAALDAYEGVDRGLYVRVRVPHADSDEVDDREGDGGGVDDESGGVAVYVGDPDRLGVDAAVGWPGGADLDRRVRRYVEANDVVVDQR